MAILVGYNFFETYILFACDFNATCCHRCNFQAPCSFIFIKVSPASAKCVLLSPVYCSKSSKPRNRAIFRNTSSKHFPTTCTEARNLNVQYGVDIVSRKKLGNISRSTLVLVFNIINFYSFVSSFRLHATFICKYLN